MVRNLIRNVLAVVGGLFVGMVWNMSLIQINMRLLFPMPEGLDMNDTEKFNAFVVDLPPTAFILVIIAHLGQALIGGWLAARFGASQPVLLATIVGVVSLMGGIMAMMMISGPAWMVIELPLYIVLPVAAGLMEKKRRAGLAG